MKYHVLFYLLVYNKMYQDDTFITHIINPVSLLIVKPWPQTFSAKSQKLKTKGPRAYTKISGFRVDKFSSGRTKCRSSV